MRTGQAPRTFGIDDADCQFLESLPGDVSGDIDRHGLAPRQFADPEFGGDFPGGRCADGIVKLTDWRT